MCYNYKVWFFTNKSKGLIIIFEQKQIGNGVFFYKYTDGRFKTNEIQVLLHTDFDELPRADYAAAEYILADCCRKFQTHSELSKRLADMYGASLYSRSTITWYGRRCTSITGSVLDDRFALNGENLEADMCDIICECLLDPNADGNAFDRQITETQRAQLIDDIDSVINEKSNYAVQRGSMAAFRGEAFELPVTGTHEEAERVTPESAYAAYRKMLKTARIDILCSGASDFAEAERIFTERLSTLERGEICELSKKPSALKDKPETFADTLPMQQAILRMYFKAPELEDRYAGFLFSCILGGMTTSRFFLNIREKQSLCYYCSTAGNRILRTLTAYAGIEPQNIERVKEAILAEINDICENGVTEEELRTAKLEMHNTASSMNDNPLAMISWYHNQILEDKILTPEEYCAEMDKVSAERVREAARKYSLDTVYTLCSPDFDAAENTDGEEAAE